MTAGRERSAGQASLAVAAGDRVSLRVAGGRDDGNDGRSSPTYRPVDNRLVRVLVEGLRTIEERARLTVVDDGRGGHAA